MSRHHQRLDPRRWAAARRACFRRDGYRCRECGKAERVEAHHEPPMRADDDRDPYDVAGLVTMCRRCHIARHREDDMTPGRADWLAFVEDLAGRL